MDKSKAALLTIVLSLVVTNLAHLAWSIYTSTEENGSKDDILVLAQQDDSDSLEMAYVAEIIDGDTFRLVDGRVVRYIGMDAPEIGDNGQVAECFGLNAKVKNEALLTGKKVRLESDVSQTDHYGRYLYYVWLDSTMFNQELVREGYAFAASYPPDTAYDAEIAQAQEQAQASGMGLWTACSTRDPIEDLDSQIPSEDQGVDFLENCVIKGNISMYTGEKIYHAPGGYYYEKTVIDPEQGEEWFCSEEDALAAGWRKSKK